MISRSLFERHVGENNESKGTCLHVIIEDEWRAK
jgi:hypothetical protein